MASRHLDLYTAKADELDPGSSAGGCLGREGFSRDIRDLSSFGKSKHDAPASRYVAEMHASPYQKQGGGKSKGKKKRRTACSLLGSSASV